MKKEDIKEKTQWLALCVYRLQATFMKRNESTISGVFITNKPAIYNTENKRAKKHKPLLINSTFHLVHYQKLTVCRLAFLG